MTDQELAEKGRIAWRGVYNKCNARIGQYAEIDDSAWLAAAKAIREQVEAEAHARGMREAAEIAEGKGCYGSDCGEVISAAILKAIPAPNHRGENTEAKEDVCEWTYDDKEHAPKWDSSCGEAWCFIEGGPEDNRVRFCQGCGKPIKIKEGL